MDNWLKGLIAAACAAIIAAVGYFAVGELTAYKQRAQIAADREYARNELFNLATAGPDEVVKVRAFCKVLLDHQFQNKDNAETVDRLARNCSSLGYN